VLYCFSFYIFVYHFLSSFLPYFARCVSSTIVEHLTFICILFSHSFLQIYFSTWSEYVNSPSLPLPEFLQLSLIWWSLFSYRLLKKHVWVWCSPTSARFSTAFLIWKTWWTMGLIKQCSCFLDLIYSILAIFHYFSKAISLIQLLETKYINSRLFSEAVHIIISPYHYL
jgi:hypothetical protein